MKHDASKRQAKQEQLTVAASHAENALECHWHCGRLGAPGHKLGAATVLVVARVGLHFSDVFAPFPPDSARHFVEKRLPETLVPLESQLEVPVARHPQCMMRLFCPLFA